MIEAVLSELVPDRFEAAEVFAKEGRSRRLAWSPAGYALEVRHEEGWAIRAGGSRSSIFLAGTGAPGIDLQWPEAQPGPLRLPEPTPLPPWSPPADLDAPLVSENEGLALLEGLREGLRDEIPEAALRWAVLEDGGSHSRLVSSRGLRSDWRHRSASLCLGLSVPGIAAPTVTVELAAREARAFHPRRLARRTADRLLVRLRGAPPERDRGEFLLAPEVGIRLLLGLLPFFVGREAEERIAALRDRSDRVASPLVTLVDDGRQPGGVLAAPVDGEGLPTRRVVLVDEGVAVQPLVPWWDCQRSPGRRPGATRRDSWREPPRPGPTHLFLEPDPEVGVGELVTGISRGYYLLDVAGPGSFELAADRFALPVGGFALENGEATGAVTGAWLCGGIRAFLRGIQARARDLTFLPVDGMIGAPSLVATGLELRRQP